MICKKETTEYILEPVYRLFSQLLNRLMEQSEDIKRCYHSKLNPFNLQLNDHLPHPSISHNLRGTTITEVFFDPYNQEFYAQWTKSDEFKWSGSEQDRFSAQFIRENIEPNTSGNQYKNAYEMINSIIDTYKFPFNQRVIFKDAEQVVQYFHLMFNLNFPENKEVIDYQLPFVD